MEGAGSKFRIKKLRLSFIFAAITVSVGAASYVYHIYKLFQDSQINKPQPQVERLVKDLRGFHAQRHGFPNNFVEINQLIWRTTPAPDYGVEGRQARTKNYYYYYTKISDDACVFWALPLGPRRDYAASYFVVLSPEWMRAWKGQAMSDEQIAQIPAIPPPAVLAELKMLETPSRIFNASK
ncbi:MAG: hypothetical protein AB7U82_34055 [Blastocatellales bacterium]